MNDLYKYIIESNAPLIMGILNVTPDSFSDGGIYFSRESAIDHAIELIEAGSDIIDIGGESTRPGADSVNEDEELSRVIPIISEIRKKYNNVFISVDTSKSRVAEEAIENGANLVNDISGSSFDLKLLNIAAKYNVPYVTMHIKGNPKNMQNSPYYENVINEVFDHLKNKITELEKRGINKIIVDPGIGFGKRVSDNYTLLNNIDYFKSLNKPLLIGLSKKSFLGKSLNLDINSRENSTTIVETVAALKGADIIRTHNVKNAVELKNIYKYLTESKLLANV